MYFVDREKIEKTLVYLQAQMNLFNKIQTIEDEFQKSALERTAHMMMDCVLDVGNAMIDGFIMRDPGSYDDIIDILLDEKVIDEEMSTAFKSIIKVRKVLVQNYLDADHENIYDQVKEALIAFEKFPTKVRDYLANELGPVTAFKAD